MTDRSLYLGGSGVFGLDTATGYARKPHGFDGSIALDYDMFAKLQALVKPGSVWGDPGGGSGWLSIEMAKLGARVLYSDRSPEFVAKARVAVAASDFANAITITEADVYDLPGEPGSLDGVLLSNVGCAVQTLGRVFQSVARLVKPGGVVLATAPASLDQVFCAECDEEQAVAELEAELATVKTVDELRALVARQTKFHRATLRLRDGVASLVRDIHLPDGTDILRLISGENPLLVPNFWHDERAYRWAIGNAGLLLGANGVIKPTLSDAERTSWNAGKRDRETLGRRYGQCAAFGIYHATKPLAA